MYTYESILQNDIRHMEIRYNPVTDSSNNIIGATAFITDISERIKSNKRLEILNEMLQKQNSEYIALNNKLNNHI